MDITQIVRVGYGYYPNPTCIKNKKIKNKTINLSHRHSHSLCLSSVLTDSWSLSLSPVSANPHHHSLSLSLSLPSSLRVVGRFCLSHIHAFIGFGIDLALDSRSSFSANQLGLSTTLFP